MSKYINIINESCIDKLHIIPKIDIPEIDIPDTTDKIKLNEVDECFSENYVYNMPSLFYFLDGFVNNKKGDILNNVMNYLKNNNLMPSTNIYYMINELLQTNYNFSLNLKICKSTIDGSLDVVFDQMQITCKSKSPNFIDLFKKNHYWITHNGYDKHATSLVLYTKNNVMYLMSFNSGANIDLHKYNNNKYLPYFGFILCDDIQNSTKLNYAYDHYMRMLFFGIFYNFLSNLTLTNNTNIRQVIDKFEDVYNFIIKEMTTTQKKEFNNEFNIDIDITEQNISIKKEENKSIEYIIELCKSFKYNDIHMIAHINSKYYILLFKYFNKCNEITEIKFDLQLDKFDKNNINLKNDNEVYKKIPEDIKNKNNLHVQNNELYIHPQQSGSCTWFSVYWPLLFYHIIHTNDFDEYLKLFNKICTTAYNYVCKIFKIEYIVHEYQQQKSYYNYMINMCHKLVNLNILDKSYLKSVDDLIYNISIDVSSQIIINEKINITNVSFIHPKIDIFDMNIDIYILRDFRLKKQQNSSISTYIQLLLQILSKNKTCLNIKMNTLIIILWELFINNINIYKNKLFDITKMKKKVKYEMTDNSKLIEVDKLLLYMNIYNNVLEINNKSPIFVIKYYHLIIYLYNFYKEHNICAIPKFTHQLIIDFSIYMYKFELFNQIIYLLYILSGYGSEMESYRAAICDIIPHILLISDTYFKNNEYGVYDMLFDISNQYFINIFEIYNINPEFKIQKTVEFDTIDIDILENYNMFLLNHPEIIFDSINQDIVQVYQYNPVYPIYYSNFIQMNIFLIFENEKIRTKLLKYFLQKYYKHIKLAVSQEIYHIRIICKNIQLLLHKYTNYNDSDYCELKSTNTKFISFVNFLAINTRYPISGIINILHETITKYNNEDEFCDYIMNNQYIFSEEKTLKILLEKHMNILQNNNIINKTFNHVYFNNSHILTKTFCKNKHNVILISDDNTIIYILTFDFILQLTLDKNNFYKIINIEYNGNTVIKYKNIIAPFKYTIPRNFIYLIYKSNNMYNIVYFINSDFEPEKNNLFNPIIIEPMITLSINPHNLLFPNKMSYTELNNYTQLLLNGGINKYNSCYVKPNKDFGAYIDDNIYKIIGNDIDNISTHINSDIEHIKINFLNEYHYNHIISLNPYDNKVVLQIKNEYFAKSNSLNNLLLKISKCNINPSKHERSNINNNLIDIIKNSNKMICDMMQKLDNNIKLSQLFVDHYEYTYKYLSYLKIANISKDLLNTPNNELCSKIKIYNEQLKIKKYRYIFGFEIIFELFFGNEITNEQYDIYVKIINSYKKYRNETHYTKINKKYTYETINVYNYTGQVGGELNYPLYHFMMGKGKSSVITPLLTLYFALIERKKVFIIVPDHLKSQTIDTICTYTTIFNLNLQFDNKISDNDDVIIISDTEIKEMFLNGYFIDDKLNNDIVFLIDEFDSVLDPIKSNYNMVIEKKIIIDDNIINIIKDINILIKNNGIKYNFNDEIKKKYTNQYNIDLILIDINIIIKQLTNTQLKENINWGIHPTKCHAIPFMNKDKPLINSNFSSCILTIFLTFYYYIYLYNNVLMYNLYNYVKNNNLFETIFKINKNIIMSFNDVKQKLNDPLIQKYFFETIFEHIMNNIRLSKYQFNTSFIDIINISNVFKIGYSGTVNIDIPQTDVIFMKPVADDDEEINVKYAILKSNIINIHFNKDDLLNTYFNDIQIKKYSALIDACGLFKNYENDVIAMKLHQILKRPIIFLNNKDEKLVIDEILKKYDEYGTYINPFLYYSQTHIIGIDIKQDKYPIIKGLCIIDHNSLYTTVAQAIFRLRKLNMGHSIDFNIVNKSMNTTNELYNYLKKNDELSRKNKEKILLFQTLKSSIRKRKIISSKEQFKNNYKEMIKYYYIKSNYLSEMSILDKIIDIYNMTDIETVIYKSIKEKLNELVFNINSFDIITQKKINIETEKNTEMENKKTNDKISIKELSFFPINCFLNEKIYFKENFLDDIKINIDNSINISINVFSLKGIFTSIDKIQSEIYNFYYNDYMFVFHNNELTLINSTMMQYIYNKYPILNINLSLINYDYVDLKVDQMNIIKKIYDDSALLQILNHKNMKNDILLSFTPAQLFVLINIFNIYNKKIMNHIQQYYYEQINNIYTDDIYQKIEQMINSKYAILDDTYKLRILNNT